MRPAHQTEQCTGRPRRAAHFQQSRNNVSIALGALFGSLTLDHSGPSLVMVTGMAFCALALLLAMLLRPERTVK
ncbi:hypothetical protein OHQ89_51635 [Streptomyces canus]|uniref:hypothetical protein n=1 Tax=Streptomyces canus TaxID=58343 RepID=UPI0030E02E78